MNSACDSNPAAQIEFAGEDLCSTSAVDAFLTRSFDIASALAALIFFGPLMVVIALILKLTDRGPIVFAQRRIGRNGNYFRCYKFRTMVMDAEERLTEYLASNPAAAEEWARDHKLRDDPRVTAFGRFLRRSSLDELPQLFNVLRGDMSIVGPRPIVPAEIERYGRYFAAYCSVRPGITGLWQISGRNDVSYEQRVQLDTVYARTRSIWGDINIALRTVPAVIKASGSY